VSDVAVEQLLARHGKTVDRELERLLASSLLPGGEGAPARLSEAMRYSLTAGGKRLRPALVLECHGACSAHDAADDPSARVAAAAIELVHTFSLVHDDLPAMDDDDLRRGKPTNHKVFGEAVAILAGDGMLTLAFAALAGTDAGDPAVSVALAHELSSATMAMIGGQTLDIEGENQALSLEQLQHVHRLKTGALITAACRMGGITARASERQLAALTDYGRHLGIAFQIVDDILDVTSTPQELGKATSKDAGIGKNTYPRLLGLDASRAAAAGHVKKALTAMDEFAASADGLRALARFVERRSH
jgi:geranylgeranyl diphosphate synthase type II